MALPNFWDVIVVMTLPCMQRFQLVMFGLYVAPLHSQMHLFNILWLTNLPIFLIGFV